MRRGACNEKIRFLDKRNLVIGVSIVLMGNRMVTCPTKLRYIVCQPPQTRSGDKHPDRSPEIFGLAATLGLTKKVRYNLSRPAKYSSSACFIGP